MTNKTLFALGICAIMLQAQNYPPPFPREAARLLFENDRVAVWDVLWPKGKPTAMHEHPVDQLSVTLSDGSSVRVTRLGGTPTVGSSKPGAVVFTPKGTVHMEEGISDIPQRKIMLQLKTSDAAGVSDGDGAPLDGATKLLDNARVTAWSATWKPGWHDAGHDAVIVFVDKASVIYVARGAQPRVDRTMQGRATIVELK